jgi:hypothetical protein
VLFLGLVVALVSLALVKKPSHEFAKPAAVARKQRWIFQGMRPLLLAGAGAVALLVVSQMLPHSGLYKKERTYLRASAKSYKGTRLKNLKSRDPERWIDRAHLNRDDLNMLFYPDPQKEPNYSPEHVKDVTDLLQAHPHVWPVLLSGAIFLYLWWLAALLFDLAFVWQRYVRNSVANERLKEWHNLDDGKSGQTIAGAEAAG